jgi:hypothetical protein
MGSFDVWALTLILSQLMGSAAQTPKAVADYLGEHLMCGRWGESFRAGIEWPSGFRGNGHAARPQARSVLMHGAAAIVGGSAPVLFALAETYDPTTRRID